MSRFFTARPGRPSPGGKRTSRGVEAGTLQTPAPSEPLSEKTTLLEATRRGQGRQGRSGKIDPNNARWKRVREYPQSPWADRRSQAAARPPGQSLRAAPRAAPGARAVSRPGLFRPCPGRPSCMETGVKRCAAALRPREDRADTARIPCGYRADTDLKTDLKGFGLKTDLKGCETV